MPYALRRINIPGTLNAGYQRGSEIHESVIASWGLIEGEDWQADVPDAEVSTPAVPRPVDDGDRNAWVAYVVSRGTDPDEARDLDLADLMELYPERDGGEGMVVAERPADSAKKAEWIDYVIGSGGSAYWARDDSTTKADLQAWQPDPEPAQTGTDQHTTDPAADQGNATVGR